MNIFVTHPNPVISARWLDDKRANQLIRESGQLLSTTINLIEKVENPKLYNNFAPNHPCRLWAGASRRNFYWLMEHMRGLLHRSSEDTHLKAKEVHSEVKFWFEYNQWKLPDIELTTFCNCAGNEGKGISFKGMKDVPLAYRLYLNERWKTDARRPTWLTGSQPDWAEV